jgi:hypothetical protein
LVVPFPLPLAPEVTVIQALLLTADQAHPAPAVTPMDPLPLAEACVRDVGLIV